MARKRKAPKNSLFKMAASHLGFSWKHKLIALIAVTLLGLGVLTASTFVGLDSINQGFEEKEQAEAYRRQSLLFANKLLALERASNDLTLDKIDQFLKDLDAVIEQSSLLETSVEALGQQSVSDLATQLSVKMSIYKTMKAEWVELSKKVGFSNKEGAWAQIEEKGKKLDGLVKLELIAKPIDNVINNQKNWLNTRQMSFSEVLNEALTQLEGVVEERKWQKIVIGQAVSAYREAFDPLKQLLGYVELVNAQSLTVQQDIEAIILKQSELLDDVVIVEAVARAEESKRLAITMIVTVAIVVGLILFFSLGAIAIQLNIQLGRMAGVFNKVAEGDLSASLHLTDNKRDEFNRLAGTVNKMIHDISGVVGHVVESSRSLLQVRDQLTSASEKMAHSSERVEHETERSTEATQQISVSVNDVAKRASDVSQSIGSVTHSTQAGVQATVGSVESMRHIAELISSTNNEVQELSSSSEQMEGIIDVINSLADQTNLLALNAAIESARAGEAGRGFAVVADEVRALAQKTVSATGNIGSIISEFNGRADRMAKLMEKGISLVDVGESKAENVSNVFSQINESVEHVAAEIDQVVVSVQEISSTADGIAAQMDQICQHTSQARTVRETLEHHITDLDKQSESLVEASSRFHLSSDHS